MKTYSAKPAEIKHSWYIVDAKGQTLGRMASRIAGMLRGKHVPEYTPHVAGPVSVVVINADQVVLTGKKAEEKVYYSHTQYPGGIKEITYDKMLAKHPGRAVSLAVKGMLPKNSLGRAIFKNLKVYAGAEHPHAAQQPQVLEQLF